VNFSFRFLQFAAADEIYRGKEAAGAGQPLRPTLKKRTVERFLGDRFLTVYKKNDPRFAAAGRCV
jgi:hypothetical protein